MITHYTTVTIGQIKKIKIYMCKCVKSKLYHSTYTTVNQIKMPCRVGLSSACVKMCKMCKNKQKEKQGGIVTCQKVIEPVK